MAERSISRDPEMRRSARHLQAQRVQSGVYALLAAAACAPPVGDPTPPPADILFTGENVDMGVEDGLEVCGRSFAHVDRFIDLYLQASADGPIAENVQYFFLTDATLRRPEICGDSSAACARNGVVYASSPSNLHEVVHAVRQLQSGSVGSPGLDLFEEGLAQQHYGFPFTWAEEFSIADSVTHADEPIPRALYDRAGHFMSYLTHRYSAAAAEAFVDVSEDVEDTAGLDRATLDVFDITSDELQAEYNDNYPRCSSGAWARLLVECAAEPLAWIHGLSAPYLLDGKGGFACSHPDSIGPVEGSAWTYYLVDIPASGSYKITTQADDGQTLGIYSCEDGCGVDVDYETTSVGTSADIDLTPGRHVVRIGRSIQQPGTIGFSLRAPSE